MAVVTRPTSKLEPVSMKSLGFTAGVEQADPNLEVNLIVAVEDQSPLRERLIYKTGKRPEELEKEITKAESEGLFQNSEDWRNIRMVEKRGSNHRIYLCEYKGKYSVLNHFIYGEFVDDGQVIKQISPPHPRTYVLGYGSTTSDTGSFGLEEHKDRIESYFRSKYANVEWRSWADVMKTFAK